jgi:hypothetical protein
VRLTCAAPPNFIDAEGRVWQARASALIVSGGYAEAAPGTVIAGAGGLQPVFQAECSGSLALSLPAPVDAHYDVTLLAARPRSRPQRSRRSRPLRILAKRPQRLNEAQAACWPLTPDPGPSDGPGAPPQAENFFTAPQQRVFDVLFQGQAVLRRVDLVALVGARTAWQHTVSRFPVAGGRLNITFANIVRRPSAPHKGMRSRRYLQCAGTGCQYCMHALAALREL